MLTFTRRDPLSSADVRRGRRVWLWQVDHPAADLPVLRRAVGRGQDRRQGRECTSLTGHPV